MTAKKKIAVIATTISGSIKDQGKIKRIVPLFKKYGQDDVSLFVVDSHLEAREKACKLIQDGNRIIISAGGSGTFNSVLEGCCDSHVNLREIRLGFLRKGSADLIGKVLGISDDVEEAIKSFIKSIDDDRTVKCDIILTTSKEGTAAPRHFVGYGGTEIFGEIPHFTENRFVKYYKGILSQFFGDLGPFFVGTSLTILSRLFKQISRKKRKWQIFVDEQKVSENYYQAMIIVNGDLGPDLPFARSVPLGSGDFYLFAIKDLGVLKLFNQFKHAWDSSILDNPAQWGFESYCVKKNLELKVEGEEFFPVNIDGATMLCKNSVNFRIVNQIALISALTSS